MCMKPVEVAANNLGCVPYISAYGATSNKKDVGRIIEWRVAIEHCELKLHRSWKRVFLISKCGLALRDSQTASHLHDASEKHRRV